MIIWLNGSFGAGKTTISEILAHQMTDARIFDPEDMGYVIQKTFPEARHMDYQDLPLWRRAVIQFIIDAKAQFSSPLIVPMTLVKPDYIHEIFSAIANNDFNLYNFFLATDKEELHKRITNQVMFQNDPVRDKAVRQWRLAQIERCCVASAHMPKGTIFLDTNSTLPDQLVESIMEHLNK